MWRKKGEDGKSNILVFYNKKAEVEIETKTLHLRKHCQFLWNHHLMYKWIKVIQSISDKTASSHRQVAILEKTKEIVSNVKKCKRKDKPLRISLTNPILKKKKKDLNQ